MQKKWTRLWLIILCASLLLSGCELEFSDLLRLPTAPTVATTAPKETTQEPTVTTTAGPDAAQIYEEAVNALGADGVKMEIQSLQTMTVAGQMFTVSSVQSVGYWNLGSENLIAEISDTMDFGDYEYTLRETYLDGTIYQTLDDCYFTAKMDQEDFRQRYPGLRLLDPALYTLTLEEGDTVIRFENASGVEQWLAAEDMELIQASGEAKLTADGKIGECTYLVEYDYGPAHYAVTYSVSYSEAGDAPTMPQNAEEYTEVEDIDGMWLLDVAYGYLLQAKQYSSNVYSSIQSQAAGFVLNTQYNLNACETENKSIDYRLESSIFAMDSTGDYDSDMDEKFIGGKYTASMDGGEEEYSSDVTEAMMENYVEITLTDNFFVTDGLTDAAITDLGSLIFVEYSCTEEQARVICEYINEKLFNQPDLLDSYASSYRTNKMEYYLALDKYTMLPTAVGYLYEGCHTIEGMECLLIEQLDQSFDLASLTSYEAIHEKISPDTEPEVKPTPLFYKVTGPDGQLMWLFGTIHIGDDRTGYLPQEIYDALKNADALAVECDTEGFSDALEEDETLQNEVSKAYYFTNSTIADHLDTEDLYEHAVKVMKATGSYFYNSEYMKAALWSSSIDNYYLSQGHSLTSEKGIEKRLEAFAEENGVPLWEVESSLFQIRMLTGYSDHLQEFLLYSSAYGHGKANWEASAELYELWLSGDEAALIEEMAREPWSIEEEDFEDLDEMDEEDRKRAEEIIADLDNINAELEKLRQEYVKAMESDRNAGMLEVAKEYLESGDTVFFAVGLAHLLAEDGLVFTLREAGYTVELVTFP